MRDDAAAEIDRLRAQLYALTEDPHRVEWQNMALGWSPSECCRGKSLLFCRGHAASWPDDYCIRIVRERDGEVVT